MDVRPAKSPHWIMTTNPFPIDTKRPREEDLFDQDAKPNMNILTPLLFNQGRVECDHALFIFEETTKLLTKEPNLLHLDDPMNIVGDIHGQYYDFLKVLDVGGDCEKTPYLFLGDLVDRGLFGMEVLLHLCSLKLRYPSCIWMLRGNHESRHLSAYFNFYQECVSKYDEAVYQSVCKLFDSMPLAAVLNDRFLCVHGGISPDILTLDDIDLIDRFREVPSAGPFCDLLWSDPFHDDTEDGDVDFTYNDVRNCSYIFSYKATCDFLEANDLIAIFRGHEVQEQGTESGFKLYKKGEDTGFPVVVCVFSAPNYCDTYGNLAAIIRMVDNSMNIRQFKAQEHPYQLPNNLNAFAWSLPFVTEKLNEFVVGIMGACDTVEGDKVGMDSVQVDHLKSKIMALGKMHRMLNTLQKEKDIVDQVKSFNNGLLPIGLLSKGGEAIKDALKRFQEAKKLDEDNEKRPFLRGDAPVISRTMSFKGKFKHLEKIDHTHRALESPSIVLEEVDEK